MVRIPRPDFNAGKSSELMVVVAVVVGSVSRSTGERRWHSIFISKIRFNEKNSPEHPGFTANRPHLRDAEFNKQDCAWKLKGPQLKTQLMMFGEIYPRQKYPKQGTS